MTRDQALAEADAIIESALSSGDLAIFKEARDANGNIDQAKLVSAATRSRERLADMILSGTI